MVYGISARIELLLGDGVGAGSVSAAKYEGGGVNSSASGQSESRVLVTSS